MPDKIATALQQHATTLHIVQFCLNLAREKRSAGDQDAMRELVAHSDVALSQVRSAIDQLPAAALTSRRRTTLDKLLDQWHDLVS